MFILHTGSNVTGTGMMAPSTLTGTSGNRMRNRSSSSSDDEHRRRNIPVSSGISGGYPTSSVYPNTGYQNTGYPVSSGFGTTGYNQSYAPNTLTSGTGQHLDSFNHSTTAKQTKPGFVEKIKYKLRSRR